MNKKKLFPILAISILSFAGCVIQRAEMASQAQSGLIGKTKADILSCAGVPLRSATAGDLEFLTYSSGGDSRSEAIGSAHSGLFTAIGARQHRSCDITFTLRNGIVQRVSYSGRTGGLLTKGEQCAFAVESCMSAK